MAAISEREDRIAGTLLGLAAGDALGAGYEFGPPLPDDVVIAMNGGGAFAWEPGEWTDDTGMAVAIALAMQSVRGHVPGSVDEALLDAIAAQWGAWSRVSKDIGNQTREIFTAAGLAMPGEVSGARLRQEAVTFHERTGRSAGNGSLMRTTPISLYTLASKPRRVADLARAISGLTHVEESAGDACVLWNLAIRHAINTGTMNVLVGLPEIEPSRRDFWRGLTDVAEAKTPRDFPRNGWVIEAFQSAWSAIVTTRRDGHSPSGHLARSLEAAVRGGHDTDTVAAIAGSLVGAAYGASAIPSEWTDIIHGWPGISAEHLSELALAIAPA